MAAFVSFVSCSIFFPLLLFRASLAWGPSYLSSPTIATGLWCCLSCLLDLGIGIEVLRQRPGSLLWLAIPEHTRIGAGDLQLLPELQPPPAQHQPVPLLVPATPEPAEHLDGGNNDTHSRADSTFCVGQTQASRPASSPQAPDCTQQTAAGQDTR